MSRAPKQKHRRKKRPVERFHPLRPAPRPLEVFRPAALCPALITSVRRPHVQRRACATSDAYAPVDPHSPSCPSSPLPSPPLSSFSTPRSSSLSVLIEVNARRRRRRRRLFYAPGATTGVKVHTALPGYSRGGGGGVSLAAALAGKGEEASVEERTRITGENEKERERESATGKTRERERQPGRQAHRRRRRYILAGSSFDRQFLGRTRGTSTHREPPARVREQVLSCDRGGPPSRERQPEFS